MYSVVSEMNERADGEGGLSRVQSLRQRYADSRRPSLPLSFARRPSRSVTVATEESHSNLPPLMPSSCPAQPLQLAMVTRKGDTKNSHSDESSLRPPLPPLSFRQPPPPAGPSAPSTKDPPWTSFEKRPSTLNCNSRDSSSSSRPPTPSADCSACHRPGSESFRYHLDLHSNADQDIAYIINKVKFHFSTAL